jgi:hypothetical protein
MMKDHYISINATMLQLTHGLDPHIDEGLSPHIQEVIDWYQSVLIWTFVAALPQLLLCVRQAAQELSLRLGAEERHDKEVLSRKI